MTKRQPKGIPVGGQFAQDRKPDGADLTLPFVNHIGANLSGDDFENASLEKGHFLGAKCVATSFAFANLKNADFLDADCTGANFDQSRLESSILMGNFENASFRCADLSFASCYEANFAGADFTDAYMPLIDMRKATGLETAKGLATITGEPKALPDGWSYAHGQGIFRDDDTERKVLRVANRRGVPWEVRVIRKGERYGRDDVLVNDESNKFFNAADPVLVEFWDAGQDESKFPGGCQFVSRYSLGTLLDGDQDRGLNLDGGEPRWSIDGDAMSRICTWLKPVVGEASDDIVKVAVDDSWGEIFLANIGTPFEDYEGGWEKPSSINGARIVPGDIVDDEVLLELPDGSRVKVQLDDFNAVRGLDD